MSPSEYRAAMTTAPLLKRKWVRLRDFDYSQAVPCSVTVCAMGRRAIFVRPDVNGVVIDCLQHEAERLGFRLIAYCLMPDHLHLLVIPPGAGKDVSAFVGAFKSRSTRLLWAKGLEGRVWQASFYDHLLRKDEDIEAVANYIVANPVRKGIASGPEAYPFSRTFPEQIPH